MQIEIEDVSYWRENSQKYPWFCTCGVYFLFYKGELVYVGKSKNIGLRISTGGHNFDWDAVSFVECEPEDAGWKEAAYIGAYKPIHNKWRPKEPKRR